MPLNRTSSSVAIGLLLCLLASPSFGQGPLGFQLFAPADVSTYGGEQEPNEGYFFQVDGLYWSISAPKVVPIGYAGTRKVYYGPGDNDFRFESNTLDTSGFSDQFSMGDRIEFGRVEDRDGWFVSIFQLRDQSQDISTPGADIVFNDPAFGLHGERLLQGNVNNNNTTSPQYTPAVIRDLPTTFTDVLVDNAVDTWGVEANYLHRFKTCHDGGTFEMFLGARYYEFNDNFSVTTGTDNTPGNVPSFLGGSSWQTSAQNHVVGPQIGLRWFKKRGRWTFSTEGRFFAGINFQNIQQQADMGPHLNPGVNSDGTLTPFQPLTMAHSTATYSAFEREWSPAIELRLEGRYQITRAISFHAGWTGMWMDGVARASSLINYRVGDAVLGEVPLGIDMSNNRQGVFVNGLTLGFDINR
jgi:hypothetical protein